MKNRTCAILFFFLVFPACSQSEPGVPLEGSHDGKPLCLSSERLSLEAAEKDLQNGFICMVVDADSNFDGYRKAFQDKYKITLVPDRLTLLDWACYPRSVYEGRNAYNARMDQAIKSRFGKGFTDLYSLVENEIKK